MKGRASVIADSVIEALENNGFIPPDLTNYGAAVLHNLVEDTIFDALPEGTNQKRQADAKFREQDSGKLG